MRDRLLSDSLRSQSRQLWEPAHSILRIRDAQHETDGYGAFTWVHTFNSSTVLEVSPFYHYNSANYQPRPNDIPVATTSDRASNYGGAAGQHHDQYRAQYDPGGLLWLGPARQLSLRVDLQRWKLSELQHSRFRCRGGLIEEYISDNYKPRPGSRSSAGCASRNFTSSFSEDETYPRVGIALQIPKLNWVFRGFYGRYYQPPPLLTASGSGRRLRQREQHQLSTATWRAGRRTSVRRADSVPGLAARCRHFPDPRQ